MRKANKTVYFSDSEDDSQLLNHAEKKNNFSQYVKSLIRSDIMGNKKSDPYLKSLFGKLEKLIGADSKNVSKEKMVSNKLLEGIML